MCFGKWLVNGRPCWNGNRGQAVAGFRGAVCRTLYTWNYCGYPLLRAARMTFFLLSYLTIVLIVDYAICKAERI